MVARTAFARRLLTWTRQRLWGERSPPDRPGCRAAWQFPPPALPGEGGPPPPCPRDSCRQLAKVRGGPGADGRSRGNRDSSGEGNVSRDSPERILYFIGAASKSGLGGVR